MGWREIERVLPENTITANIHVRTMRNTELYMFLESDPYQLVFAVSTMFFFSFFVKITDLFFPFAALVRYFESTVVAGCGVNWQISPAECDLPSSSTTAPSGNNNPNRGRGGYFLLRCYWLQLLSVTHEQSQLCFSFLNGLPFSFFSCFFF